MDPMSRALTALRRARSWTPAQLAAESGVAIGTIRAIENGDGFCDPATGDALIRAFVKNNPEATWLAIFCARTFQVQWNTVQLLIEVEPAGEA